MLTTQDIEQIRDSPEGEGVRVISGEFAGEVFRSIRYYGAIDSVLVNNKFRGDETSRFYGEDSFFIKAENLELTVRREA